MNVNDIFQHLTYEVAQRRYVRCLDILEQSASLVKARLYITTQTFVQIYRNDRFNTTNLVLIHNDLRIYGRDELDGMWHRHPVLNPQMHDTSIEGKKPFSISDFLNEVELILADMDLI